MPEGVCPLCLDPKEKKLYKSHYMPAALYPKGRKLEYATRASTGLLQNENEIKNPLLCFDCEQRFDQNGESEVLRWINPKGKRFPLSEMLKLALPRDYDPTLSRYSGSDLGVDMDKFAYFAISMVWRGSVHDWVMFDGTVRPRTELGVFLEPMRLYLMGKAPMPPDTSVIVIVTSDEGSRKVWTTPSLHVEADCLNFRFLTFGVLFRVMMGRHMWDYFRDQNCVSARKCLFYGSAKHRMPEIMQIFEDAAQTKTVESTNVT
ncbi:MAG: hypothetical protein WB762_30760 [Candidatus Sulfotelmatobacter sp.]